MVTLFVRHEVADYAAWRAEFDKFAPNRAPAGIHAVSVYRDVDRPSMLTVTHDFDTVDAASGFWQSVALQDEIARLDIIGETTAWIAERD